MCCTFFLGFLIVASRAASTTFPVRTDVLHLYTFARLSHTLSILQIAEHSCRECLSMVQHQQRPLDGIVSPQQEKKIFVTNTFFIRLIRRRLFTNSALPTTKNKFSKYVDRSVNFSQNLPEITEKSYKF